MWKKFAYKLRPVWTLTWVEATTPTLRSQRPQPSATPLALPPLIAMDKGSPTYKSGKGLMSI